MSKPNKFRTTKRKNSARPPIKSGGSWPVTYRWMAMGTLVAYSAIGWCKVGWAAPPGDSRKGASGKSGEQSLVVRRFEISEGSLDSVALLFEKTSSIHIAFQEDGLRAIHSPGVTGIYTIDQALTHLLEGTGVVYRFTSSNEVTLQIRAVATSVNVTADAPVMVASPKYTELLRDTPQTVTVIPQGLMQEQGVNTLRDALRNVAGISLAAGEGGAQGDNLTIRGFTARNDIFLDGMRDFGSYYRDSFNFESVDVLQGPTSVTFGRGSTGGVVNQESKTPQSTRFISGAVQLGSDMTRRITADINEPIGQSTAFRLNLMRHDSQVADRDIAENRRVGIAPSLSFGLGTTTRLTLSYYHQSEDDTPDYGIPWLFNAPAPVDRSNYYGFEHGNYLKTQVDIGSIRLEHDFGHNLTLRNQARCAHYDRDVKITEARVIPTLPDGSPVTPTTPVDEINVARNQIAVNSLETFLDDQLDMTARFKTAGLQHDLVFGIELSRETSSPTRFTYPNSTTAASTLPPGTILVPNTGLADPNESQIGTGSAFISSISNATANSIGAYFVDTVHFGRHLDLMGGIRWDYFDTTYSNQAFTPKNQTNPVPTNLSQIDRKPTYRAAIVYKPKNFGSIYFDYGTSFNPSAETLSLSAANFPGGHQLDPESNRTFEVGTKWDLPSRRLSIAGSIFSTEKLNAREPSQDNPLVNVLAGTQRVNGVQIAVTGRITDRWQMLSSYAYLDGTLVSSIAFPADVGAQLANVPRNTFNLWTTYGLPWKLTVGGGTQFVDARTASSTVPLDPTTGLVKQIPGYWLFNAMASRPISEHISAQINFYNLANKYYYDEPHPRSYYSRRWLHCSGRTQLPILIAKKSSEPILQKDTLEMLLAIPELLTPAQVAQARQILDAADWIDGKVTAGHQSARVKDNEQLPEGSPAAQQLGDMILNALGQNPLFVSAALPLRVFPPLFNRYRGGQSFGTHVDNAIRQVPGTGHRIRTDLSATLFFAAPDEYDGGELVVEDTYGVHSVKLPAGHLVLYPSTSLHHVKPVTRGARVSSFFWIQSMIRDDGERTLLFDLDVAIQRANREIPEKNFGVQLTGIYHNLLRRWADA